MHLGNLPEPTALRLQATWEILILSVCRAQESRVRVG